MTSTATIPAAQTDTADVVARADGVVAGLAVAAAVFESAAEAIGIGRTVEVSLVAHDGERVARGDVLATVTGPTRVLLTAERTALNLLCRMSGVATHTRAWADALAGSKAMVLDTRKTTPGLRALEKYAVRAGGGTNKRMGLHDVAMVKDNHKFAAGGVAAAYRRVREAFPTYRCRWRWTPSPRPWRRSRPEPTSCCWTTCLRRCSPRWWPPWAIGPSWRRPAG